MFMVDTVILTDKSKEELIEIILALDRENNELREKVKAEQQKRNEKFAKPNTAKKRKKSPGQKMGHVGLTRRVPDQIDETIEETLFECPDCHHALGEPVSVEEQIQEDIIPAHVRTRKGSSGKFVGDRRKVFLVEYAFNWRAYARQRFVFSSIRARESMES